MDRIRLAKLNNLENEIQTGTKLTKTELTKLSFKERFRIKCHLSAGAHGIILWAIDRGCMSNKSLDPIDFSSSNFRENCHDGKFKKSQYIKQYAIKRIFIRNRNIPIKLIREIKSLQFLKGHSNVS